ncbi:hypothetical protein BDY24DRAFT_390183 [Mrakia frigida]|uniref:zinc finger MYND domain-containing protein n=1 Tax=Mrakia frigida TaxID=29902 RepID=UPI003FCC0FC5
MVADGTATRRPLPSIQEFAHAYKLDDEGARSIEGATDTCAINRALMKKHETMWNTVESLDEDAHTAYLSEFANSYLPNLIRAYVRFLHTPCDCMYSKMISRIQGLPQFSRWIREHEEGPKFIEFLVKHVDENTYNYAPEQYSDPRIVQALANIQRTLTLLHWSIVHSPPTLTLSLSSGTTPNLRARALSLQTRISSLVSKLPAIERLHPDTKEIQTTADVLRSLDADLYPFLRGHGTALQVKRWHSLTVWWTCSGMLLGEECEDVDREEMFQCARCKSVRYCSKRHQKADWKKGHKLVCYAPTW